MSGNFTAKLLRENGEKLLFLVNGTQSQEPAWCYMLVGQALRKPFLEALAAGTIDLSQFGEILFFGSGSEPSDDIRAIIQSHYNA